MRDNVPTEQMESTSTFRTESPAARLAHLLAPPLPPEVPLPKFWKIGPRLSRRSWLRQIQRELIYRVSYIVARFILMFGIRRATRLANYLGPLGGFFFRENRRIALKNLEDCLGKETTLAERKDILRQVYSNFALSAMETLWISHWGELFNWLEIELDGMEHLEKALASGRGVIALHAHFGSWEVFGAANAKMGLPVYVVVRQQKDPRLNEWIVQIRKASGLQVITRGVNPVQMIRCLRRGNLLGLFMDLDTRSNEGVFVDFFGRPTYTQIGPFVLARRTGALVIPTLCYREGLNRLRFHYGEPWEVPRTDDPDRDILEAAQRANSFLEKKIRERPEQWTWFHKRWKTTPAKMQGSRMSSRDGLDEDSD
jgi:KDO2-lipid IV(A) lauroyltransferase